MTTAIRLKVVRYQCPHCRRTHSKKQAAELHIARCWYNPAARACKTCVHFTPEDPDGPYPEHPGWREQCEQGRKLLSGLHTECPMWEAPAPCPECQRPVPQGLAYCSQRCRNAADRHDQDVEVDA
jgi:endogenous inhibitor of DNA gyrase (YacG/DUF329 family)